MNYRLFPIIVLGCFGMAVSALADEPLLSFEKTQETFRVRGSFYEIELSLKQPQILRLAADSLGQGRFARE